MVPCTRAHEWVSKRDTTATCDVQLDPQSVARTIHRCPRSTELRTLVSTQRWHWEGKKRCQCLYKCHLSQLKVGWNWSTWHGMHLLTTQISHLPYLWLEFLWVIWSLRLITKKSWAEHPKRWCLGDCFGMFACILHVFYVFCHECQRIQIHSKGRHARCSITRARAVAHHTRLTQTLQEMRAKEHCNAIPS